jgi:hypothetical protein
MICFVIRLEPIYAITCFRKPAGSRFTGHQLAVTQSEGRLCIEAELWVRRPLDVHFECNKFTVDMQRLGSTPAHLSLSAR